MAEAEAEYLKRLKMDALFVTASELAERHSLRVKVTVNVTVTDGNRTLCFHCQDDMPFAPTVDLPFFVTGLGTLNPKEVYWLVGQNLLMVTLADVTKTPQEFDGLEKALTAEGWQSVARMTAKPA